jgi:hypothetical protein
VVCNLSKGEIGLDTANLLAALLVSKVQMVTFKRSADAVPYFLYLDEFQNYVTNSFEMLLSESRKYRVGLNLFHQYMTQIPDSLQHAIVGNVGTFVSFRIPDDTRRMGKVLGWDEDELQKLKNYTYVARRLVKGQPEESLHMKADPPPAVISDGQSIVKASQDNYGVPAWVIDDYIEHNIIKKEGENDDRIFGVDDSARQGNVRFLEIYRANGHDFPTEQVVFPSKGKRGVK